MHCSIYCISKLTLSMVNAFTSFPFRCKTPDRFEKQSHITPTMTELLHRTLKQVKFKLLTDNCFKLIVN